MPTTDDFSLPVIDVEDNPEDFGRAVGEAFHAYDGFCLIRPSDDLLDAYDRALDAWDDFVALDDEERRQYQAPRVGGEVGFNPMYTEQNRLKGEETSEDEGNPNRYYHIARDPETVPDRMQDWFPVTPYPDEVEAFQPAMEELYGELEALAADLLAGLSRYAEEERGTKLERSFDDHARYGHTVLRLLDYPEQDEMDADTSRIGAHEDRGLITILKTDGVGGLRGQVGPPPHDPDAWGVVDNDPDELVVNIGEAMTRLTNGFYPATRHGVWATTPERRRSIPFFVHAAPGEVLTPQQPFLEGEDQGIAPEWSGHLDMDQYTMENINKRRREGYGLPFLRPKEFHALNQAAREDGPDVYRTVDADTDD